VTRPSRFAAAAATGIACLLGMPLAAHAASKHVTKDVTMGLPTKVQKQKQFLGKWNIDAIDFFPHTTTIHVGDSIRFSQTAFHNVDLPAKGQRPIKLLATKGPVGHVVGKDGVPFWYSDSPSFTKFGFNPLLIGGNPSVDYSPTKKAAKKAIHKTYDGSKRVWTTIPFNAGPRPIVIKFTKAGTYTFYCDLHPGEKGVVHVLPARKAGPGAKADKKALNRQIARDRKVAVKIHKHHPLPADTVSAGYAGKHGVEIFTFVPNTLRIPVGTTVTFRISPQTTESHTATTGVGNPEVDPDTTLGQIAASFFAPTFDSRGAYPSESPFAGVGTVNKSSHGEGFWSSGVLDNQKDTLSPTSSQVTFTQAGTYDFWCMVHPQMHGRVVVG
jgi:plastocyanin